MWFLSQNGASFAKELYRAGFQGDKLSVWAVQGLHGQQLPDGQLQAILEDVSGCAAFHSLIVGELPAASKTDANVLLAEYGLLGAAESFQVHGEQYQRGARAEGGVFATEAAAGGEAGNLAAQTGSVVGAVGGFSNSSRIVSDVQQFGTLPTGAQAGVGLLQSAVQESSQVAKSDTQDRWLFASQQMRLSLTQMGVYGDHVAAAEGADEDFYADVS